MLKSASDPGRSLSHAAEPPPSPPPTAASATSCMLAACDIAAAGALLMTYRQLCCQAFGWQCHSLPARAVHAAACEAALVLAFIRLIDGAALTSSKIGVSYVSSFRLPVQPSSRWSLLRAHAVAWGTAWGIAVLGMVGFGAAGEVPALRTNLSASTAWTHAWSAVVFAAGLGLCFAGLCTAAVIAWTAHDGSDRRNAVARLALVISLAIAYYTSAVATRSLAAHGSTTFHPHHANLGAFVAAACASIDAPTTMPACFRLPHSWHARILLSAVYNRASAPLLLEDPHRHRRASCPGARSAAILALRGLRWASVGVFLHGIAAYGMCHVLWR